jgi:CHAT domain-containing protein
VITRGDRLRWSQETQNAYRGLSRCLYRVNKASEAFEIWETFLNAKGPATPPGRVQDANSRFVLPAPPLIPVDTTILSYFFDKDRLVIWTVSRKGMTSNYVQVDRGELMRTLTRLQLLAADPNSDLRELRSTSAKLYTWLVKPVETAIASSHMLYVEPEDLMGGLPFEILLDERGRYLLETHSLAYVASLTLRPTAANIPFSASQKGTALIVGNPALPASIRFAATPLADAQFEAEGLAALFPHSRLLTGRQATAAMVEKYLPSSFLFHFAGHSVLDRGRLKLLLASDDARPDQAMWDLAAIPTSKLRSCVLVVLSACTTQGEGGAELHDPTSPVAAILDAHVAYVIASRWTVDSPVTAEYMQTFYRGTEDLDRIPDSLRACALEIAKGHPHPYYWAAFSLFGHVLIANKETHNVN